MKPVEIFKSKILSGDIKIPVDEISLISLMDRYSVASSADYDLENKVDKIKDSIITVHGYNAKPDGGCYISSIRRVVIGKSTSVLNGVVQSVYGVDLITYCIQRLIVDGKIRLVGKKVFMTEV